MSDVDVVGPIDAVLIEFDPDKMTGEAAEALLDLVERGVVQVLDLVLIVKDQDGTFSGLALDDAGDEAGGFAVFSGACSGLLGDEDLAEAADAMLAGTAAALIVYENTWARPFVAAARKAGGEMIASIRIPAKDVMDALDALDVAG
ncbi:MAG: DUF6325 family protein [Acidimicrobiales bacterium]|jgi:dihydroorotase-like cyclic amidohydrolase|nr:DUF6325 family protein [Acidimicrobiales bacterium]